MSIEDLGSLQDYILNGDNYQRVLPDGSTLVIPGNLINGQPHRPVAPSREAQDSYYIAGDPCQPISLAAGCAVWSHDATTGYWHVGPIAQYNPEVTTCLCALVGDFEGLADPAACRSELEAQLNALDGRPLNTIFPGWWLALNGFAPSLPIVIDQYFIACLPVFVIIPRTPVPPPPAQCTVGTAIDALGVCKEYDPPVPFPLKDITMSVPRTPPPTTKPQKIFLPNPNPIELSGVAPWPLPQVIMAPECTKCMTGEDGEEEAI